MLRTYRAPIITCVEHRKTVDSFLSLKSALPVSNITYCTTVIKIFMKQNVAFLVETEESPW